jgi:hypothetical protein
MKTKGETSVYIEVTTKTVQREVCFWKSGREDPQYGYTAGGKETSTESQYVANCRSEVRRNTQPNLRRERQRMLFALQSTIHPTAGIFVRQL